MQKVEWILNRWGGGLCLVLIPAKAGFFLEKIRDQWFWRLLLQSVQFYGR